MTVSSTTNRKEYAGNGVTTSFATSPVVFFASEDLTVYVVSSAGVVTTLTENTHYTVTGGGTPPATGTVNLAGGSSPYGAPATGATLAIVRDLDIVQETDFVQNDGSDADVSEAALDRAAIISQQLDAKIARSVRLADSDTSGADTTIPTPEANSIFGWNALGTALVNYVVQAGTSLVDLAASTGASLIGFIATGTGAVLRTVMSKLRDELHGADFGVAADDVTVDTAAINLAIAAAIAQKKTLRFTGPMLIDATIPLTAACRIVMSGAPGEITHNPDTYFHKKSTMTTDAVLVTGFGVEWTGGGVVGNKALGETGGGITVQGRSFTGNKVWVRNTGGSGWVGGKSTDNTNADFGVLNQCGAYGNATDNLRLNSNNGAAAEANNWNLNNFVADSAGQDNIALLSCQGTVLNNCNGTTGGRYGLNEDKGSYTTVIGGEYTSNVTADIIRSANSIAMRWVGLPKSMVVTDNATAANKIIVLHRTGLDKNLCAADGTVAGAVRLVALNDAQDTAKIFELQGTTFHLIGGTVTADGQVLGTGGLASNVAPSSQWGIDFTSANNKITILNNGTYDLAAASSGMVLIHSDTTGYIGLFLASAGATFEVADPNAVYSVTSGTAGTNFFYNGGTTRYRVENKTGGSADYYIIPIRSRSNV